MNRISPWIAGVVVLATLGAGACDTNERPVCKRAAAVQKSAGQIRNADVSEYGLAELRTDLTRLKFDLERLAGEARTEFAAEIDVALSALTLLSASIVTARILPGAVSLAAVRLLLSALRTVVRGLGDTASETC